MRSVMTPTGLSSHGRRAPASESMNTEHVSENNAAVDAFARQGYVVLEHAISSSDASRYSAYALMNRQHPDYYKSEPEHSAMSRYGDVLGESLLRNLQPGIEAATGLQLLPCYSNLRIFTNGAVLAPHLDRPACEVSATLTIDAHAAQSWPFWLQAGNENKAIVLPPGHLLVYRGSQLEHWRERLEGDYSIQLLLRYVSANGEHAYHRFDGRRGLGEPQNRVQQDACIVKRKEFDAALAAGEDRACFCSSGQVYSRCHGMLHHTLTA